ncbi:MAG: hypothetical protein ACXQTW_08610 [Candidatus Methanospirareceae archaeon]
MGVEQIVQMILQNPDTSLSAGVVIYLIFRLENLSSRVSRLEGKINMICTRLNNDRREEEQERE